LIVSDGWDRGDPKLLGASSRGLRRRCSRVIWLNPLLGSASYEPLTRGMQAALEHVDDFLPAHNLQSIEDLATRLRESTAADHSMQLAATYKFRPPRAGVDVADGPEAIKSCLPGCKELRPTGENRYQAEITIGVAARHGHVHLHGHAVGAAATAVLPLVR
jgi:hypothetical protein